MNEKQNSVVVRVDGYTRACLTVIAVLMTVLIVALWAEAPSADRAFGQASSAAGVPFVNAGVQRERTIKAIQENTAKLDRLIGLFETGKAKVQVAEEAGRDGAGKPKAK
ncbi:MAG TPA: hypothetical protein VM695_08385 [Phycisphaerae bacterium]|nr:hypothetical protein [Phycisphaerae bacterium]